MSKIMDEEWRKFVLGVIDAEVRPYYVQRLKRGAQNKDLPVGRKGVDQYFDFDYMGSSEFEGSTLRSNLKLFRAQPERAVLEATTIAFDEPLWFVGMEKDLHLVTKLVEDTGSGPGRALRLKESMMLAPLLEGKAWAQKYAGWWVLGTTWDLPPKHTTFAFFRAKEHAENWCRGLDQLPPTE